jgi:hypothetical protein
VGESHPRERDQWVRQLISLGRFKAKIFWLVARVITFSLNVLFYVNNTTLLHMAAMLHCDHQNDDASCCGCDEVEFGA